MIKQITEQLELPIECIYQLSLAIAKTVKRTAKYIPNIPEVTQLILKFDKTDDRGRYEKSMWKIKAALLGAGIAIGIAGAYIASMAG